LGFGPETRGKVAIYWLQLGKKSQSVSAIDGQQKSDSFMKSAAIS
jgi:hypothetical protein